MSLFNFYYNLDENNYIIGVQKIVDENTGLVYNTCEEWIKDANFTSNNHILNLTTAWCYIEPALKKLGYIARFNKGKKYTAFTGKLKEKNYTVAICRVGGAKIKQVDYFKLLNATFVEFKGFCDYHYFNAPFADDEVALAEYLSDKKSCYSAAGYMREKLQMKPNDFSMKISPLIPVQYYYAIKNTKDNAALMFCDHPGFYRIAYDYDVVSMYPFIGSKIEHLPDINKARTVKTDEFIIPEGDYGWHSEDQIDYEVRFGGEKLVKGDIYIPKDICANPYKDKFIKLYEEKAHAKEIGGATYIMYKKMANSLIGSFAIRKTSKKYFNDLTDEQGRFKKLNDDVFPLYHYYSVIVAGARRYLKMLIEKTREQGAVIYCANTDGFICDRLLSDDLLGNELGSLRLDKIMYDVHIFDYNRYAYKDARGHQYAAISGLPKGMYKEGTTVYSFDYITYDKDNKSFLYTATIVLQEVERSEESR